MDKVETSEYLQHIQGLCILMCPRSETILRQREALIHKLECKVQNGKRSKYSDSQKMVKEFCRSAAGVKIEPVNVRPLCILQKTILYLFSSVCSTNDVPWRDIYDFVENRLRAIRQDIIVQALTGKEVLKILVPMTRFYIYANYKFCETEDPNYDAYLNLKQLHEILLSILSIHENLEYSIESPKIDIESMLKRNDCKNSDEIDFDSDSNDVNSLQSSLSDLNINGATPVSNNEANHNCNQTEEEVLAECSYTNIRIVHEEDNHSFEDPKNIVSIAPSNNLFQYTELEEIQSLYLLVHLGNNEAVAHVLQLPQSIKNSPLVSSVLKASISWMSGNHLPLFRLAYKLPPILACALHLHLNKVQRHALNVMSSGHNSKEQKYSVADLQQLLLFNSPDALIRSCTHYGLLQSNDGIQFLKSNFKLDVPVMQSERASFVEDNLNCIDINDLLLP